MRPIVLLVAYAAGIVMAYYSGLWDAAIQISVIGALCTGWVLLRRSGWGWLPFLCLLLMAGYLNAAHSLRPPASAHHIRSFADQLPLIVEGKIISMESRADGGYRLLAEALQVITEQGKATVSGKVLLYIRDGCLQSRPGQVIRWRSALRQPNGYGNPGGFDYPLYLSAQGIYVTAFIAHAEDLVTVVKHPQESRSILENCRQRLARHIAHVVPEPASGFLQSLLLGMRGGLGRETRQILSTTGVAHIFAISGLHFGLLALLLYHAGKWLYTRSTYLILRCPPQKILPVMLIIPLGAYLLLTGNNWATRRAFLMVSIFALLFARGYRTPAYALLASVALGLLLIDPLALFQPGYQLSFSGVAGILIWLPRLQKPFTGLPKPLHWIIGLILTTAAATFATAPATLWHFHQIAPAGLLTNLVAIPLIAWGAVPVGLVSLMALAFFPAIADLGLLISAWLVTAALDIVTTITRLTGLAAIPCYLTISRLILLIGLLLLCLPFGTGPRRWLIRAGILLLTLSGAWIAQPQATDFQVIALSVGQGDATLLSLSGDRHYLIDGGGLPGSDLDPGEQLVAPALGRLGIDRLEGVVLTHNHPDHSSGLVYIMRHFQVDNFYFAGDIAELAPEMRMALQKPAVHVHHLKQGWTQLPTGKRQLLSLFTPSQRDPDVNERSIAVFASQQNNGVLLTGDLGRNGFQQLKRAGIPGPVTLLKLPHHGSRLAHPEQYLEWLRPKLAFVSCGQGNPYGFPHQQAIEACARRQVQLLRTDLAGMLIFNDVNDHWQLP
ncbi:MAG: DNA internalization-related competence protein ComEC/Rec2 [Desulfuromonadales bacterium]